MLMVTVLFWKEMEKKALQMNLGGSKHLLLSFHETLGSILHPAMAGQQQSTAYLFKD